MVFWEAVVGGMGVHPAGACAGGLVIDCVPGAVVDIGSGVGEFVFVGAGAAELLEGELQAIGYGISVDFECAGELLLGAAVEPSQSEPSEFLGELVDFGLEDLISGNERGRRRRLDRGFQWNGLGRFGAGGLEALDDVTEYGLQPAVDCIEMFGLMGWIGRFGGRHTECACYFLQGDDDRVFDDVFEIFAAGAGAFEGGAVEFWAERRKQGREF